MFILKRSGKNNKKSIKIKKNIMNNLASQQENLNKKKAIISLVLGMISVFLCAVIYLGYYFLPSQLLWRISDTVWLVFLYGTPLISIFGLIVGKVGLKSTNKLYKMGFLLSGSGIFLWGIRVIFQIWVLLQGN